MPPFDPALLPDGAAFGARNQGCRLRLLRTVPNSAGAPCIFDPQCRGVLDKMACGHEGTRQQGRAALVQMDEATIAAFVADGAQTLCPDGHLLLWTDTFHLGQGGFPRNRPRRTLGRRSYRPGQDSDGHRPPLAPPLGTSDRSAEDPAARQGDPARRRHPPRLGGKGPEGAPLCKAGGAAAAARRGDAAARRPRPGPGCRRLLDARSGPGLRRAAHVPRHGFARMPRLGGHP